jgi:hypothetical protein
MWKLSRDYYNEETRQHTMVDEVPIIWPYGVS